MSCIPPVKLAEWTQGYWQRNVLPVALIAGFNNDTRLLKPGEGFVALETVHRNGHDFVGSAVARGASMALVQKPLEHLEVPQFVVPNSLLALQDIAHAWRMVFRGPVIGVTGSCGKTSTKDLLALLIGRERVHATPRNLNNYLGLPLTLCGLNPQVHEAAIVEAGINEVGEMELLGKILVPDISIITMVGRAHLEKLGSVQTIAREKALLGMHTRASGKVIFPSSCCSFESFRKFGGRSLVLLPEGEDMLCQTPEEVIPYDVSEVYESRRQLTLWRNSKTPSRYVVPAWSPGMMSNAALALVAASLVGAMDEDIQLALNHWEPSENRGQAKRLGNTVYYVDCYNANPDSFVEAFTAFRALSPHLPRLYVLGCMKELGERAAELHYETGVALKIRGQDRVLITGEFAGEMCRGVLDSGARDAQVMCIEDTDTLRSEVCSFEGQVLLKGSRAYALEKLLPENCVDLAKEEIAC